MNKLGKDKRTQIISALAGGPAFSLPLIFRVAHSSRGLRRMGAFALSAISLAITDKATDTPVLAL